MAPKARGDGKANDGETKSGGRGKGKNRGGDAQWSNEGEEDGGRRKQGQGKGNRKGGKAEGGGGDERWQQSGGRNRGQGQNRGGYEEEYYEGSYGYGGSGYSYGYDSWQAGPQDVQDWQPMVAEPTPAPPPKIWTEYNAPDGTPYYYNCRTGLTQWDRPKELDPPPPEPSPSKSANDSETGKGRGRDGASHDDSSRSGGRGRGDSRKPDDDGRQGKGGRRGGRGSRDGGGGGGGGGKDKGGGGMKQDPSDFGPPGCNLFVFHLPDDWTDDDLHEYFAPHGNVVSAKVMKELGTGRSRGFGFVSYEDRVSAATAVKKMQGYKILGKRLKVEFKKGEGESSMEDGLLPADAEDGGSTKKSYPDDERLIGYLRAISAKNVVQSLKENEGGPDDGDALDGAPESELVEDLPNDD